MVMMMKGRQQSIFNSTVIAERADRLQDDEGYSAAQASAIENIEIYSELVPQNEDNKRTYWKYSKLYSRAIKVETCLIVAGTLIWGFGDLVSFN